jgi:hypothetical protein
VRATARFLDLANAPAARHLTLFLAVSLLLFRRLVPGRLVQRALLAFVQMEAACCRAESPHFKLLARNIERFERAGSFDRMRRFLRTAPRLRAARRLDAWVRIGLSGSLRHEVASRHAGEPGVLPRMLTQAQLALSPGCDLTCEGCYTDEDRGGAAPRRARMAWLVAEAAAAGAMGVHVIGKGEPFLSPAWAGELLDVIASRPDVFFTVATHGMRIDEALAARLGRLGNVVIMIAVDGPEPLHDARRGAGSYRRVHETFARLRRHGVLFGYSAMVSAKSHAALVSLDFIRAQAEAGCAVGIHSRYFPLAASASADLALSPADLARYTAAFDALHAVTPIPLSDFDEIEQHTGCHSRAGESVYIDGISGQVSPCLRVPFSPADCRLDEAAGVGLGAVLTRPYFLEYRRRGDGCPSTCGANLPGELAAVGRLLDRHAAPPLARPARLDAYDDRSRAPLATSAPRRLPLLPPERHP